MLVASSHPVVRGTPPFRAVLDDAVPLEVCARLVKQLVDADPKTKPVIMPNREMHRNVRELSIQDAALAAQLFETVRSVVPASILGYTLSGVPTRARIFEHRPGCFFGAHEDYQVEVGDSMSLLTLLVYLTGGVDGGETVFEQEVSGVVKVAPKAGRILLFNHTALHRGDIVRSGTKFTLRSDVLYRAPA